MTDIMNPSFIDSSIESRAVTFENPTGARGGREARLLVVARVLPSQSDRRRRAGGARRHRWPRSAPSPLDDRACPPHLSGCGHFGSKCSTTVPTSRAFRCRCSISFACHTAGALPSHRTWLPSTRAGASTARSLCPSPITSVSSSRTDRRHRPSCTTRSTARRTSHAHRNGYLHVLFRRENPTQRGSDFVIAEGLVGPGRFLGCSLGIRVLDDGIWYGEGEVKMFFDGDTSHPTICGTGLEDYVGSAWGMGRHAAPYGGCTLDIRSPDATGPLSQPDFVGIYRWHLPDPIMYRTRSEGDTATDRSRAVSFRVTKRRWRRSKTAGGSPVKGGNASPEVPSRSAWWSESMTFVQRRTPIAGIPKRWSDSMSQRQWPISNADLTRPPLPWKRWSPRSDPGWLF